MLGFSGSAEMIQSLFLILKDISHVLSNQNMNGKWSFPKKGMLGAHGVQRSKNCFQLRAGRGRYGSQRSGNVKVKERLYQAEGCEQRAEAGRFFPGGTVVLPPSRPPACSSVRDPCQLADYPAMHGG